MKTNDKLHTRILLSCFGVACAMLFASKVQPVLADTTTCKVGPPCDKDSAGNYTGSCISGMDGCGCYVGCAFMGIHECDNATSC